MFDELKNIIQHHLSIFSKSKTNYILCRYEKLRRKNLNHEVTQNVPIYFLYYDNLSKILNKVQLKATFRGGNRF